MSDLLDNIPHFDVFAVEDTYGVNTSSSVEERVAAGAQWLDTYIPGWVDSMVLDWLDMGHCGSCVLGQLLGSYSRAKPVLTLLARRALGFDTARLVASSQHPEYDDLRDAWVHAINERWSAA